VYPVLTDDDTVDDDDDNYVADDTGDDVDDNYVADDTGDDDDDNYVADDTGDDCTCTPPSSLSLGCVAPLVCECCCFTCTVVLVLYTWVSVASYFVRECCCFTLHVCFCFACTCGCFAHVGVPASVSLECC
jgi:hypothetical protein